MSAAGRMARLLALALTAALMLTAPCPLLAEEADGRTSDPDGVVDTFVASAVPVQGLAVLSSSGGETTVERYYGSQASGDPVAGDTLFEWGRCSDLIVWACVMQLVESGDVAIDGAVAEYIPESVELPQGYDSLTIGDLMDHTAGLDVAMTGSRSSIPAGTTSVMPAFSLFDVQADRSPGDEVAYTPLDALLGAAVVEQASGLDFCEYARERVLEPLGMRSTELTVGGSSLAGGVPAPGLGLALDLSRGVLSIRLRTTSSVQTTSSGTVFSCFGTGSDLLRLAEGLVGTGSQGLVAPQDAPVFSGLFAKEDTSRQLFSVSRTYPGLGIARVAHGMFAFPLSSGVFGISASTTSGYSAAVYMSRSTGLAIVALASEAGRFDLVQGIPRVLLGRSDALSAQPPGPAAATWSGSYQDASKPDHGPAKLLTALTRTRVGLNEQGVLTFDGVTATSLGAGVYSIDTAQDQDLYRFHVGLERGSEFSRVTSDSYIVPFSTIVVEDVLLAGLALSLALSLVRTLSDAVLVIRGRIRRRRPRIQPGTFALAAATCAAGGTAVSMISLLADGVAPSALGLWLAGEGVYVAVAIALSAWLLVTRLGGGYSARQRVSAVAVVLGAAAVVANLVYWEMLP